MLHINIKNIPQDDRKRDLKSILEERESCGFTCFESGGKVESRSCCRKLLTKYRNFAEHRKTAILKKRPALAVRMEKKGAKLKDIWKSPRPESSR